MPNRLRVARYALVQWPDKHPTSERPREPPCCIALEALEATLQRGAFLIGREDAILAEPIPPFNAPRIVDDA